MENDKHIENLEETSQEIKANITRQSAQKRADQTQYQDEVGGWWYNKET